MGTSQVWASAQGHCFGHTVFLGVSGRRWAHFLLQALLHPLELIAAAGSAPEPGVTAAKPGASVLGAGGGAGGEGGGQHVPNKQPVNDEECTNQRVLKVASVQF